MWQTVFSLMHELWSEHVSLACSGVNLAVYKLSTRNAIFQDTEKTYSRCVYVLCATWQGTFQTLAPAVWVFVAVLSPCFLFLVIFFFCQYCRLCYFSSLLLSFVLIHIISPIIFAVFLFSFLLSFLPALIPLDSFSSFTPFLPFVIVPLSFLLSLLHFYPHIRPCPVPSLYYLFAFLCISASYSTLLLHAILERPTRSLGLNKSTGTYEYMSRCIIQEKTPSVCKPMSHELRRPSIWIFYYCRSPTGN